MNERPQRKTPAHLPVRESFNKVVIVFLTVCTDKRRTILARSDIHDLLRAVWTHADHWRVGRYVIMPDHFHLFCSPGRLDSLPLTRWVQFWKSVASRQWLRNLDATKRVPPNSGGPRSVVAEIVAGKDRTRQSASLHLSSVLEGKGGKDIIAPAMVN